MMKTARWISAGVFSLMAGFAGAGNDGLVTVPVNSSQKPDAPAAGVLKAEPTKFDVGAAACDLCAPVCDPCCPAKPPKIKTMAGPRPKIIVHQSEPIVEFRNDAPAKAPCATCQSRPTIQDRAVKPCGGELFGHGCGCKTGLFKKHHNPVQANPAQAGAQMQLTQQTVMTAVPITVQAYVPQVVQTMAMVPTAQTFAAPFAGQSFVGPTVGLNAGFAGLNVGATSSDMESVRRAVEILSAMNGTAPPARTQAAAANGPSNNMALQAAAAAADKANSLESRIDELNTRLSSVEKRLKALCETK